MKFSQAKSEHPGKPDRHVGITGKIEIDLYGKTGEAEPGIGGAEVGGIGREHLIGECAERVGNQELASETARKAEKAVAEIAPLDRRRRRDLIPHLMVFQDRTSQQFGKEKHKQA